MLKQFITHTLTILMIVLGVAAYVMNGTTLSHYEAFKHGMKAVEIAMNEDAEFKANYKEHFKNGNNRDNEFLPTLEAVQAGLATFLLLNALCLLLFGATRRFASSSMFIVIAMMGIMGAILCFFLFSFQCEIFEQFHQATDIYNKLIDKDSASKSKSNVIAVKNLNLGVGWKNFSVVLIGVCCALETVLALLLFLLSRFQREKKDEKYNW